ncbi:hypothetical protein RGQ29_014550 [Quercus rubra]|uniref:VQ domain-containing protein n=1 Tax=Quercus rubra TaxID=3512 RepID=A0AAN7FMQ5_QUERU|nr:hypothetical protein RGQ29_014550 [Quercus rubra]
MDKHMNHHFQHDPNLKSQKPTKTMTKPIKITYISSPMIVKACDASEFRAIVQELTGKNSSISADFDSCPMVTEEEPSQALSYDTAHETNSKFDEGYYFWRELSLRAFEFESPCDFV